MNVKSVTNLIEIVAPLALQESYDNAGLLLGSANMEVTAVLITIDVTEAVVDEAIKHNCNLIIAHHPLIFNGLKKITGKNEVQRCIIKCIQNNIAVYAAHTNIDNVLSGVNGKIADKIGLTNRQILVAKSDMLLKLVVFVPKFHAYRVREAIFKAGGGHIGNYDFCSFNSEGNGTFRAGKSANPFVGEAGKIHTEKEEKIEIIIPAHLKERIVDELIKAHPYEEPAYDLIPLQNKAAGIGAGLIGELPKAENEYDFLMRIKKIFGSSVIRHTHFTNKLIKRVAVCGGSGSLFLKNAISAKADIYISGDFKYHEFFESDNKILIADIGHFESEQFTKDIFYEIISRKMPTFAVRISETKTNPINYL